MRRYTLEYFFTIMALVTMLTACASSPDKAPLFVSEGGQIFWLIPVDQVASRGKETPRVAQVQVSDIRKVASAWALHLRPSASELVKVVIEAKADEVLARHGVTKPQTVYCGIREFDITSQLGLVEHVSTQIELVLRVHGQERTVRGMATDRTVTPGPGSDVPRVTIAALEQVGVEAEHALEELFDSPH
jgi:hypothetical protein